jgi:hypothetical protein
LVVGCWWIRTNNSPQHAATLDTRGIRAPIAT